MIVRGRKVSQQADGKLLGSFHFFLPLFFFCVIPPLINCLYFCPLSFSFVIPLAL